MAQDDGASVAGYMQLEDSPEDAEQLMLFQLPPLVPAHNRHRKLPAMGALQLKVSFDIVGMCSTLSLSPIVTFQHNQSSVTAQTTDS